MAHASIEGLSNELLLRIVSDVFQADNPGMHDAASVTNFGSLWSLCLTSRRLNWPATEIFYENMFVCRPNSRCTIMTLLESPQLASMVKTMKLRCPNSKDLLPRPPYRIAPAELDCRMEEFVIAQRSKHNFGQSFMNSTGSDVEMALTVLRAEKLHSISLYFPQGRSTGNWPRDPSWQCLTYGLLTKRDVKDHIPAALQNSAFQRLHSVRLSWQKAAWLDASGLAHLLQISCIRSLCLEGCYTFQGLTDLADVLRGVKVTDSPLSELSLHGSWLSMKDLKALGTVLRRLTHLSFRARDPCTMYDWDSEIISRWNPKEIIRSFNACRATLQDLCLQPFGRRSHVLKALSKRTWTPQEFQDAQHQSMQACDLSGFVALRTIRIEAICIIGLKTRAHIHSLSAANLPASVERLHIIEPVAFEFSERSQVRFETVHSAPTVRNVVVQLFSSAHKLHDTLTSLKHVGITIPATWRGLPNMTKAALQVVLSKESPIRLTISGPPSWHMDSVELRASQLELAALSDSHNQ